MCLSYYKKKSLLYQLLTDISVTRTIRSICQSGYTNVRAIWKIQQGGDPKIRAGVGSDGEFAGQWVEISFCLS